MTPPLRRRSHQVTCINDLVLGFWNIHGFKSPYYADKFVQSDFTTILESFDIFGIAELHRPYDMPVVLPGYYIYHKTRPRVSTAKSESGGILIGMRESIRKGITIMSDISCSEYIWLKLHKDFFKLPTDLFVAYCYVAPRDSSYAKRQRTPIIQQFQDSIVKLGPDAQLLRAISMPELIHIHVLRKN